MRFPFALIAAVALPCLATPTLAQVPRYECRNVTVSGMSSPERRRGAAERGARRDWEAAARTQFGFAYRWAIAQEVTRGTYTQTSGALHIGHAQAYPCRVFVSRPHGTLTTSDTPERQRVCGDLPSYADAQRLNCPYFYPLRR